MNLEVVAGRWKQVQGGWKQVQGVVLCRWGRFTENRFAVFVGEQCCVNGRIQERLGQLRTASRARLRLVR